MNELHSKKDYTNQSLKHLPAEEFNNSTIKGTCFYQEVVYGNELPSEGIDIFPDGVTGLILERCNVDNVYIPPGVTVRSADGIDSSQRKIMCDDEGHDCLAKDNGGKWEPDKLNRISVEVIE